MRKAAKGFTTRAAIAGLLLAAGSGRAVAGINLDHGRPAEHGRATLVHASGPREPRQVLIIFEDADGPCRFPETTALRDRYAQLGVTFTGPGDTDGGAILGDCSKFGIEGYGGYRFLAFNAAASLAGGGTARGPESLGFSWPVQDVEILAGSPAPGEATLTCFDQAGIPVGTSTITLTRVLQPLHVSGQDMVNCRIEFSAAALVLDNLRFTPQAARPIPAQTPLGAAVLVSFLLVAGSMILRSTLE